MFKNISILSVLLLIPLGTRADIIAHYAFDGSTFADSAGFADVNAADLTPGTAADVDDGFSTFSTPIGGGTHSLFLRGAALNITPNSTSDATAIAITQGNYVEFSLTSTEPMFLTSLTFSAGKNTNNIHALRMLASSSINGHTYNDRLNITDPVSADGSLADVLQNNVAPSLSNVVTGQNTDWGLAANTTIDLSDAAYQGLTSIDFRIYAFAINAPTASNLDILRIDNIRVNGSTIPEPTTASLLLLGCAGIFALRKR